MIPEPQKHVQAGWLALAGSVLIVILGLWIIWDDSAEEKITKGKRELANRKGPEALETRIKAEQAAVEKLRVTIEELKKRMGFDTVPRFQVPTTNIEKNRQPGFFFKQMLVAIRDDVRNKAKNLSVEYETSLGFDPGAAVPPDDAAPYLLTMLQLTEKAVNIVLGTHPERPPIALTRFSITHDKAVETGPASRPVLLREYPLVLKVVGSLDDLLWILHRLSQVDAREAGDYPLILRGLTIDSENVTAGNEITQLTATFQIAGMQFLSDDERKAKGGAASLPSTVASPRPESEGDYYRARP